MSTVSERLRINQAAAAWPEWTDAARYAPTDDRAPVVLAGTEHQDAGEPIPARRPRPFSPSQAEAEATAIAERCAGLPSQSLYAFKCGAYESLYGELHAHYLDAVGTIERMRRDHYPFFSDELSELPDAAYYDPAGDDRP